MNEITVYRDLSEISALNQWDMRRSDTAYTPFMGRPQSELEVPIRVPRLVGPTLQAAQVNLRELITSYRSLLLSKKKLVEVEHSVDDAFFSNGYWHIGGFAARKIIDCTGSTAMQTSTWAKLPWRGTKGEALRFSLTEMPRNLAIKMRHFICPIGNTNEVWLGGTNQDHFVDNAPSTDAEAKLAAQAVAFEIALPKQREHLVAIRPTVKDRRPLVGEHPEKPGLWICNGFGTKGTSLGPFCTEQLANALLIGDTLDVEIDIKNRFCTD